jgi:hypothetical protein
MQQVIFIDVSDVKAKGIDILKTLIDSGKTIQFCVYIPDYKQLLIITSK